MSEKTIKSTGFKLSNINFRNYMMIFALLTIWLVFSIISEGTFIGPRNMSNLMKQATFVAILAIGMNNVIILGGIDLSVGSLAALCGGVLAVVNVRAGLPIWVAVIACVATGVLLGVWNGWWVAYRRVPAFIVTLAGLLVFRAALLAVIGGITIVSLNPDFVFAVAVYTVPNNIGLILGGVISATILFFLWRGRARKKQHSLEVLPISIDIIKSVAIVGIAALFVLWMNAYKGIPVAIFIVLVLFVVFYFISNKTVFGRHIYAIGGNSKASSLAGINIKKTTLLVFALNGLIAAIAGIFLTSRLDSASALAATTAELSAIAACVIGGTSLMGGIGKLPGALIGALVMASIVNGMSLLQSPVFLHNIVQGLVLLLAVWFDVSRKSQK